MELLPSWYRDSFYNITPTWDEQLERCENPVGSYGLASMHGYQSCPLPLGPSSEVSSRAEPPSTVGPSASMIKPNPNRRRADFNISHYPREVVSEESKDTRKGTPKLLNLRKVEKIKHPW